MWCYHNNRHLGVDHCSMALGNEKEGVLAKDLKELKVGVAHPFLVELCHDYQQGMLERYDRLVPEVLNQNKWHHVSLMYVQIFIR